MRYQDLTKEINQGNFHPVYLFTGPEQYIAAMMEKRLVEKAVPESLVQLNVMSFSEKETDVGSVVAICRQLPMMSDHRVVILREETGILQNTDAAEELLSYIQKPEPSTVLLIYSSKPDKRKKVYKQLVKYAAVVEYHKLTQMELEKWIARRLKLGGKRTTRRVVERFIGDTLYLQNEDQNMERVDNELGKLMDYVGDAEAITLNDLEATLPKSVDENIFRMVDFAMGGNMGEALMMLENFYLSGESPFGVFGLLLSQLRTMLQVRILTDNRSTQATIAKEVGRPPFVVKKMQGAAGRFPQERLMGIMAAAAQLDVQMKTGVVEPELGVELFVLRLGE
ncbi:DNA polymerase III subunit delta [Eubacterium barkeri]|uniref:DNA polymerase III subunit delta n=1 Tax=Eubacterium barkeri TaxID=1528 RepID=A0A1H3EK34_EUBBA|nr:DNA polymerase III subunit delta [Eubacterium barkeri]SDX78955.1 DNA polymerase III, delta subunit [Eubacterium barkeri]